MMCVQGGSPFPFKQSAMSVRSKLGPFCRGVYSIHRIKGNPSPLQPQATKDWPSPLGSLMKNIHGLFSFLRPFHAAFFKDALGRQKSYFADVVIFP